MRNLNKPPRYNVASVQAQQTLGGDVMESAEYGQYVEWRDYAWLLSEKQRLQAEVERLRFAEDLLKDENKHLHEEEPLPDGWNSAVAKACDILAEKDKENARLKAEVDEARRGSGAGMGVMLDLNNQLVAEVERLTVERNGFQQAMKANQSILETKRDVIERLRKAGDAMVLKLPDMMAGVVKAEEAIGLMNDWIAAKEGKQS